MHFLSIFALGTTLLASPAHAIDGVSDDDYEKLKALIKPFTYELTQPALVYNWHDAGDDKKLTTNAHDPLDYNGIESMANRYWEKQTDPTNTNDMFGTGLYAALDPVTSKSYGGTGNTWALSQLRLPSGFRILNVVRDGGIVLPLDQTDLITRLGCPAEWADHPLLTNFMNPTKYQGHPKCAAVMRKLFKDDLKIDGFAYGYQATSFKDCVQDQDSYQKSAFVIVNGDKLRPSDVSVYSRLTRGDTEERARIQATFLLAKSAGSSSAGPTVTQWKAVLHESGLDQYAPYLDNMIGSSSSTTGDITTYVTMICPQSPWDMPAALDPAKPVTISAMSCVKVAVPSDKLTAPYAPSSTFQASAVGDGEFLWKDLEGKPIPNDMGDWMRANFYSCAGSRGYKQAATARDAKTVEEEGGSAGESSPSAPAE